MMDEIKQTLLGSREVINYSTGLNTINLPV